MHADADGPTPPVAHSGAGVSPPSQRASRVFLLTWHKTGSQWLRDLLTHHAVAPYSGLNYSGTTFECFDTMGGLLDRWPETAADAFVGPVYIASIADWERNRRPGDKAVVLVRDPRDIVVSMMYSLSFSHLPNGVTERVRPALLSLPMPYRLQMAMLQFRRAKALADWCLAQQSPLESALVTSYERLVANTRGEVAAIFEFLGWPVPAEQTLQIVESLSFERRSGRPRGEEDRYSHFRKGTPGDWRTHFDRPRALFFEMVTLGQLHRTGYEPDLCWYDRLPEGDDATLELDVARQLQESVELKAALVRLEEENRWLRQALAGNSAA